eukprot:scaffold41342_cov445-Skeletonema_marinoi.AAC.1
MLQPHANKRRETKRHLIDSKSTKSLGRGRLDAQSTEEGAEYHTAVVSCSGRGTTYTPESEETDA